jgi:hypothetical protein
MRMGGVRASRRRTEGGLMDGGIDCCGKNQNQGWVESGAKATRAAPPPRRRAEDVDVVVRANDVVRDGRGTRDERDGMDETRRPASGTRIWGGRAPIFTTGHAFLHSCRHFFGRHRSAETIAMRSSLSAGLSSPFFLLGGIFARGERGRRTRVRSPARRRECARVRRKNPLFSSSGAEILHLALVCSRRGGRSMTVRGEATT